MRREEARGTRKDTSQLSGLLTKNPTGPPSMPSHSTGQFDGWPFYTAVVLVGAFLIGFSLQYLGLYLIRLLGFPDIDRIVLPRNLTELDLTQLSGTGQPKRAVGSPLLPSYSYS